MSRLDDLVETLEKDVHRNSTWARRWKAVARTLYRRMYGERKSIIPRTWRELQRDVDEQIRENGKAWAEMCAQLNRAEKWKRLAMDLRYRMNQPWGTDAEAMCDAIDRAAAEEGDDG